jgi:phosphatidate cytidylyltransferase
VLIRRIVTALIFGVAVVAAISLLPSVWAGIVLGAVWLAGAGEWSRFAGVGSLGRALFVFVLAVAMLGLGFALEYQLYRNVALGVALLWWAIVIATIFSYPRSFSMPFTVIAGFATLIPAWALLAWLHSAFADGPLLILALLAVVWSADSGAFFFGRMLGRNKLAPDVSPGKTWEGVIGGLAVAALVGAAIGYVTEVGMLRAAFVAAVTAAISVIGDLNVSMFKRNAGLKDSGHLLPGHGGVLDRADSVTAAVAMYVLGLILVGIIT